GRGPGRGSISQQVPALRIRAVEVLERALLLDDENRGAQPVEIVQLLRRELGERREAPGNAHPFAFTEAAAFARCSQVSTTVSGLTGIDSMPSLMRHSATCGCSRRP